MSLSSNITGTFTQTINLAANQPQTVTGPGRAFEVLQPGEAGNTTIIQALREANNSFSDNSASQGFTAAAGIKVVNFDKLLITSPVDSKMKIKVFTSKNVASIDTGADLLSIKTLWSTGIQGHALVSGAANDDPFELSGPNLPLTAGAFPTSRGDGLRELKYNDRSNITGDLTLQTPAFEFGEMQNTVDGWWTGWVGMTSAFELDVYAAPFNGPTTATPTEWRMVQKFTSLSTIVSAGEVPATDGSQTFTGVAPNHVIAFDGQDNKDYSIPFGSLRVYLTAFTSGNVYGIIGAKSRK